MKQYKLNPYSDEQKERWKDSKKIIFFEDEQMLLEFVKDALMGKVRGKKMYIGIVPESLSNKILNDFNVDLSEYNVALGADEILKIIKRHGVDEELLRGQKPLEPKDFIEAINVIEDPDSIIWGGNYKSMSSFNFIKYNKGRMVVFVYDASGTHDLRIQTIYKNIKKKDLAAAIDEHASNDTSETTGGTVSLNKNIPSSDK